MLRSMTAFARSAGAFENWQWEWEVRSVNGRGLDVKLRLPDQLAAAEIALRKAAAAKLH